MKEYQKSKIYEFSADDLFNFIMSALKTLNASIDSQDINLGIIVASTPTNLIATTSAQLRVTIVPQDVGSTEVALGYRIPGQIVDIDPFGYGKKARESWINGFFSTLEFILERVSVSRGIPKKNTNT